MGIVDRFLQSPGQVIFYYLCALSDGAVVGSNVPNLRPKNICAGDIPISEFLWCGNPVVLCTDRWLSSAML